MHAATCGWGRWGRGGGLKTLCHKALSIVASREEPSMMTVGAELLKDIVLDRLGTTDYQWGGAGGSIAYSYVNTATFEI